MKKLIVFLLLAFAFSAHAATYYFSDCQVGKDVNCVVGANGNDGLTPATAKQTYTGMAQNPGDIFLLANGGAWTQASGFLVNCATCTVASGITHSSFTPAWCVSTCASTPTKPLVTQTADAYGFQYNTLGCGFTLSNIKIVGPGVGVAAGNSFGIYSTQACSLTITNVDVSGFYIGLQILSFSSDITVKNSSIHDNLTQGLFGAAIGMLVENNTFDNNGFDAAHYPPAVQLHNIYLSANNPGEPNGVRMIVRGNTLTRSSQTGGVCGGVPLVAHRALYGLVIENNTIDESAGALGSCYGIQLAQGDNEVNERFDGAIIRGNKFINVGQRAIHISSCPYCVVENNVMSWTTANASISLEAIRADSNGGLTPTINTKLVIRNNSIYIGAGSNSTWTGITVANDGTGHRVYNNVVYLAAGTSSSMQCYSTLPLTAFTTWDYNLCFRSGGVNTYSNLYANLAAAQAAGADTHGSISDPTLTAVPAIGNGYDIAFTNGLTKNGGMPTLCPRTTYGGLVRSGTCDIGAHQQGASVLAPNSPTAAH
jgi:hypothetical protein